MINLPEDFQEFKPELLSMVSGVSYIPLYSSSPFQRSKPSQEIESESDEENSFVSYTQSMNVRTLPIATPAKPLPYVSTFKQLLKLPELPCKIPTKNVKSCGRCLTSVQAIDMMEEKEKTKQAAATLKEERKQQRELKKQQKEQQKKGLNLKCFWNFILCTVTCILLLANKTTLKRKAPSKGEYNYKFVCPVI